MEAIVEPCETVTLEGINYFAGERIKATPEIIQELESMKKVRIVAPEVTEPEAQ